MFPKSIRWRLQTWLGFLLLCVLAGFGVTAYQLNRTNQFRQIDEELGRRIAALSSDVRGVPPFGPPFGPPPFAPGLDGQAGHPPKPDFHGPRGRPEDFLDSREIRLSPPTASLFSEAGANGFFFAVWSRNGKLLKHSTNAPPALARPERPDSAMHVHAQTEGIVREAFVFTELGECVLVGRAIRVDLAALRRFAWLLVLADATVLALGLGGGWFLTSRALQPVENISAAASRIAQGNLAERINVAETDSELGRLAGVLNSTFARLEAAFLQQRQFTADASHELRTPLAVLISEAQTTLARERSAADYRETLEACLDTAQQMRRLTESLLELARLDAGQDKLNRERFDLAGKARACLDRLRPLAAPRGVQLHADLQPVEVVGDPDRLGQLVTNLLTNAIYYNREGGEVTVSVRREDATAILSVADTGAGIAAEDLPHIFERFYRADKARGTAEGRTGLGLAICQAVVQAHGGTIEVSSEPGAGTTFLVKLPLEV